jgi:hypothetical protein
MFWISVLDNALKNMFEAKRRRDHTDGITRTEHNRKTSEEIAVPDHDHLLGEL